MGTASRPLLRKRTASRRPRPRSREHLFCIRAPGEYPKALSRKPYDMMASIQRYGLVRAPLDFLGSLLPRSLFRNSSGEGESARVCKF